MASFAPADGGGSPLLEGEFRFVRRFLWWVLGSLGALAFGVLAASWHLAMDVAVEGHGTIRPRARCLVKAGIDGVVAAVLVAEGARVAPGQVLVRLDAAQWRRDLATTELEIGAREKERCALVQEIAAARRIRAAEVGRWRCALGQAEVGLERVVAANRLEAGLRDLLSDWPRLPLEELVPVRQAAAQVEAARAQLHVAESQLAAAQGRELEVGALDERRAQLEQERQRLVRALERAQVRAPVAGTVLTGDPEHLVGDRVQAGQPLLELAGEGGWLARVAVDERDRPRLRVGQAARVETRAFPHVEYRLFTGTVVRVAEQSSGEPASYEAEIAIDDPVIRRAARHLRLRDGMSATARIVVDRGRICDLARRRLLRHLGRWPVPEVYRAGPGTER